MHRITLINAEWNCYNGFMFDILNLELDRPNIDGALFGISASKSFLYFDIFWKTIKIFDKADAL